MKKNKPNPAKDQVHADQHDKHGEKETTKRHVYVEPGAQIDLVQDLKDEYKTANSQTSTSNQKQLFWAKVSTGLIAIYALITFLMYQANKKAADAAYTAAQMAVLDQRPWLYAERFTLDNEPKLYEPIPISAWLSNSGKTPGLNMQSSQQLLWRETEPPFPPELDEVARNGSPIGFVAPGLRQNKLLVGPHVAETNKMNVIELDWYESGRTKLYFFVEISYCDSLGNRYWTKQCVSHAHTQGLQEFAFCATGAATGREPNYKDCPKQ
jgi:hypothetical protein